MNFSFKKILLSTFILLELSALCAFAACPMPFEKVAPDAVAIPRVKVSISFEIARRRDCTGFGICNFTVGVTIDKVNSCSGALYVDETARNMFVLEVDKAKGISTAAYDKYFKAGSFLMEDEVPVPGDVLKALGVSGSKTLLAGKHKVIEKNGLLFVYIPVK